MKRILGLIFAVLLSLAGVAQAQQFNGYHDVGNCSILAGWAWDANQPTTPISVDIYDGNTLIATVPAGDFRQDLQNAGIGDGNHSFNIPLPSGLIDGQNHTVTIKFAGTQANLNNTPKTIGCIAAGVPIPAYNGYHDVGNCSILAGWGWDANQPTTPISVDIYDGSTLIATVPAGDFRQDLLNAGIGDGNHSFNISLPSTLINGQYHSVTIKIAGTQTNLNNSPKNIGCVSAGVPIPAYNGYHDTATCTAIQGWAWDANSPTTPISVDIYSDNVLVATVPANQFRQDLLNAGIGDGIHSFNFTVPNSLKDNQAHTITVKFAGTQTNLNTTPKTLQCASVGLSMYFIHTDHLNTPRLVADATGTTVWKWDQQEPFGADTPNEDPGNTGTPFSFALRLSLYYADKETGNFYAQKRDAYNPAIGAFPQSDPIGLKGGLNTYAYVGGNPIGRIDPSGLLNLIAQVGGSFVPGVGGEGYVGVYVTLPQYGGPNFDIGVYGSGGIGAGFNIGGGLSGGFIRGDASDIRGITYNANAGGTVVGGTAMFNENGQLVGGTLGPSSELGLSGSYARTSAAGLRDLFDWLFNKFGSKAKSSCP